MHVVESTQRDTNGLDRVAERFESWRSSRPSPRSRIPEELWREAVGLMDVYGLSAVAKKLRLNASTLKRKAETEQQLSRPESQRGSGLFIPINVVTGEGERGSQQGWRFELEYADGRRLRMKVAHLEELARILALPVGAES